MVIRRQPVISWLLEKNYFFDPTKISILRVENIIHQEYLLNGMRHLAQVREMNPDWGLPELLMPSFKKVMGKSEKSFSTIEPQLFQEFYREKVCGILIDGEITIVYGFYNPQIQISEKSQTKRIEIADSRKTKRPKIDKRTTPNKRHSNAIITL